MSTEPPQKLKRCKRAKLVKKFATTITESIEKSTNGSTAISTTLAERQLPNKPRSLKTSSKIYMNVDRLMRKLWINSSVLNVLDSSLIDLSKASVQCATSPMLRVTSAMDVVN